MLFNDHLLFNDTPLLLLGFIPVQFGPRGQSLGSGGETVPTLVTCAFPQAQGCLVVSFTSSILPARFPLVGLKNAGQRAAVILRLT